MATILHAESDCYGHLTISRLLDFFNQAYYPTPMVRIASDQSWKNKIIEYMGNKKYMIMGNVNTELEGTAAAGAETEEMPENLE